MEFNSVWVMGQVMSGSLSRKSNEKEGIEIIPFKITAEEFYNLITGKSISQELTGEQLDRIIERQG